MFYFLEEAAATAPSWAVIVTAVGAILAFIPTLVGLVTCGIKLFKAMKSQGLEANLKLCQEMATKAMEAAEQTGATGAAKKEIVLEAVQSGLKAAGVDFSDELKDATSTFIDQMITFANQIH